MPDILQPASLPKVLIVENDTTNQREYADLLPEVAILRARTLKEARQKCAENDDLRLIVIGGTVPPLSYGDVEKGMIAPPEDRIDYCDNMVRLVRGFRSAGFTGPIIEASCSNNPEFKEAGCTHTAYSNADYDLSNLTDMVRELLASNPAPDTQPTSGVRGLLDRADAKGGAWPTLGVGPFPS